MPEQMYLLKREILELRRAVMPLATPLRRLTEGYTPLVPEEVRSYFRDVDDHLGTVAGVYGMNFDHMPELHWKYGYPVVFAAVVVACLILHRIFTRRRWL